MSAIWGAISFNGNPLPQGIGQRMKHCYEKCVIDAIREYNDADTVFGCGIQFITKEAHQEVLPVTDHENQMVFTADIMLDNRDELLSKLQLDKKASGLPDGSIAYEMFKRYGEGCLNELLGAYAFVYYDKRQRKVSMVLDATGNRCLYYRIKEGVLYFSSLVEPLSEVGGNDGINERWLVDFLALDNLALRTEYEETPYAGIYRLAPRQIVCFDGVRLHKKKYWNPEPSVLHLQSDAEYASRLKEIYKKSITCLLRADKTSLLLSGGLDSTSVACYAARELKKQGKALYTYTSVPEHDYLSKRSAHVITDESESVLKTKDYLESNGCRLACSFLSLSGVNGWDSRNAEMKALEAPYKSLQNLLWIAEALRASYDSGSRILMDAGFGNVTISAEGIGIYLNDLLHKGRLITYFKQFHRFSRSFGHGRKKEVKEMLKTIKEYIVRPTSDDHGEALFIKSFVSTEMLEKHGIRQRFSQVADEITTQRSNFKAHQKLLVHDLIFSQRGEVYTKHSLLTGVVPRDPTMDKRLIEYCMSLPADQFARDGVSRRLVREYMAGDMPAHVMNLKQYGLQSADTIERIGRHWNRVYKEILQIYIDNLDSPYVDCGRAIKELERMQDSLGKAHMFDILRLGYTAMALEFIQAIEQGRSPV